MNCVRIQLQGKKPEEGNRRKFGNFMPTCCFSLILCILYSSDNKMVSEIVGSFDFLRPHPHALSPPTLALAFNTPSILIFKSIFCLRQESAGMSVEIIVSFGVHVMFQGSFAK